MREFYEAKRGSFWLTTISANSGNSQKLWRTLHGVLGEAVIKETGSNSADDFATALFLRTKSTPTKSTKYREDDWLASKHDMPGGSSSNLASERRRPAAVALCRAAFQVAGVSYFSIRLQACSGSSTAIKRTDLTSATKRILDLCLTCLFFPKYWRGLYREDFRPI